MIGLGFGVVSTKYWIYGVLKTLGLNPVHPTPSAWDWTFEDLGEKFVLVQLKNGSYFGGLIGLDSFVSSDPSERDIYVQEIYHIDDEGNWQSQHHGALIASGEVSTIEFWPYQVEKEG